MSKWYPKLNDSMVTKLLAVGRNKLLQDPTCYCADYRSFGATFQCLNCDLNDLLTQLEDECFKPVELRKAPKRLVDLGAT